MRLARFWITCCALAGLAPVLVGCGAENTPRPVATPPQPTVTRGVAATSTPAPVAMLPTATGAGVPATQTPVPAATGTPSPDSLALSAAISTIDDWRNTVNEIARGEPAWSQARADAVWNALASTGRVPLVFGNQVIFLYRGAAQSVAWSGVFNQWSPSPGIEGRTIGHTDLWAAQVRFPLASRAEYKIILNGKDWILDPANPATVPSADTVNNLLVMPGFTTTDESQPRQGIQSGDLSGNIPITSRSLGYTVNYRVYTPAGYAGMRELPVLYVLDGSDFTNPKMGSLPTVLDNLLAEGRIRPLIAVFIDPYEPGNPKNNRREVEFLAHSAEFARFVATEVVPAIDKVYRTGPRPDARTIQGVSYGGLSATFIAASYPQVFHNLAALSPSYWVLDNLNSLGSQEKTDGATKMVAPIVAILNCGGDTGIPCPALPLTVFLTFGVPDWDVGDLNADVAELQRQGYRALAIQVREGHAWSAWRGLLDEMLVFFFGK